MKTAISVPDPVFASADALAKRLLSPPSHLVTPRQVLEWAVFEAIDAEILTLARRIQRAEFKTEAPEGMAWPCCLGRLPCPHGGAARSMEALHHWTRSLAPHHPRRAAVSVTLLLGVAPCALFGLGHHPSRPNARTIRSTLRQLFKKVFPWPLNSIRTGIIRKPT